MVLWFSHPRIPIFLRIGLGPAPGTNIVQPIAYMKNESELTKFQHIFGCLFCSIGSDVTIHRITLGVMELAERVRGAVTSSEKNALHRELQSECWPELQSPRCIDTAFRIFLRRQSIACTSQHAHWQEGRTAWLLATITQNQTQSNCCHSPHSQHIQNTHDISRQEIGFSVNKKQNCKVLWLFCGSIWLEFYVDL